MKNKKKKISVYARSGDIAPAGYYRILQYVYKMKMVDLKVRTLLSNQQFKLYLKIEKRNVIEKTLTALITYLLITARVSYFIICDIIRKPDYLVLSRVFVPRYMPFYFRPVINRILKNTEMIWDFDDHILESKQVSRSDFYFLCEKSTKIIVTHGYLKSIVPSAYWNKVIILPTTDGDMQIYSDRQKIEHARRIKYKNEIRLVWVATSCNLSHIKRIIPVLDRTASDIEETYHKKLILTVVCNLPLIDRVEHLVIRNIVWTRNRAIREMLDAHIGIMPLMDSAFTKGKGGFKLVQYISIGLPVIASDVGFNKAVVDDKCGILIDDKDGLDMWHANILNMTKTWDVLSSLSEGAYQRWESSFSYDNNYKAWEKILGVNN